MGTGWDKHCYTGGDEPKWKRRERNVKDETQGVMIIVDSDKGEPNQRPGLKRALAHKILGRRVGRAGGYVYNIIIIITSTTSGS